MPRTTEEVETIFKEYIEFGKLAFSFKRFKETKAQQLVGLLKTYANF